MSNKRNLIGWKGEAFVKHLLEQEGWEVFDLAPAAPVDILALSSPVIGDFKFHYALWVEVKVKTRGKPRLTPSELSFLTARASIGDQTRVYHLRRIPGGGFKVIE